MPGPITIHIGYHKSASTFLQKVGFPAMDVDLTGIRAHELAMLDSRGFDPSSLLGSVSARVALAGGRSTVLSNESLCGAIDGLWRRDPDRIARRLARTFPAARILIVVRNQPDYILSLYGFRVCVQGHEVLSFHQWLDRAARRGLGEKLQYHRLVERYVELFGREAVLVLPMELLQQDGDSFLGRIAGHCGCAAVPVPTRDRVNPSFRDRRILMANRICNLPVAATRAALEQLVSVGAAKRFKWWWYQVKRFKLNPLLQRRLGDGGPLKLSESWSRRLLPGFARSNVELAPYLQEDLRSMGYPLP